MWKAMGNLKEYDLHRVGFAYLPYFTGGNSHQIFITAAAHAVFRCLEPFFDAEEARNFSGALQVCTSFVEQLLNPYWLMISSGITLPKSTEYIWDEDHPIEKSLEIPVKSL
jgi:hypothetical protein